MTEPTRTATTENFPVASWLLKPAARAPILAFYRFARTADDVADGETPAATQAGRGSARCDAHPRGTRRRRARHRSRSAEILRRARRSTRPTRSTCSPRSCATSTRRAPPTTPALLAYCRLSAMPVGRFVLDVHGEDRATWAGVGCAVRRAADHQPPAGLREGLPRHGPGVYPRRHAVRRRSRCVRPCRRPVAAGAARRDPRAGRAVRGRCWPTAQAVRRDAPRPAAGGGGPRHPAPRRRPDPRSCWSAIRSPSASQHSKRRAARGSRSARCSAG